MQVTESEWVDLYCITRMISRLDLVERLIPEQSGKDERFRQKLLKVVNDWDKDLASRLDKMSKSGIKEDRPNRTGNIVQMVMK